MNERFGTVAIVLATLSGAAALFATPSSGADTPQTCGFLGCRVNLTSTGPSPSTVTMSALHGVNFVNGDSVTHTVVFANGLCSLTLAPGQEFAGCPTRFMAFVGTYPYTADGKFPGTVITTPLSRSVSLTARTHSIRSGARLVLHGRVTRSNTGAAPPPPVVVLARHRSTQPFEPVATVRTRGAHQSTYQWKLSVQPEVPTTYIAKVTAQRLCYYPASRCAHPEGQAWANAKSRPFTVRIGQQASAYATHGARLKRTTIKVSTHNSRYVLSERKAPRGIVIFKITNPASQPHDFSIKGRTSKLLRTGQSTTLRVTFRRKGRYSYRDTFDHHAQFGCRGGFRIT
jgi:plastocyanin